MRLLLILGLVGGIGYVPAILSTTYQPAAEVKKDQAQIQLDGDYTLKVQDWTRESADALQQANARLMDLVSTPETARKCAILARLRVVEAKSFFNWRLVEQWQAIASFCEAAR